ncbi:DUF4959 domain-containing protein [Parabacteroides sp. APC149_11_2_Y6]
MKKISIHLYTNKTLSYLYILSVLLATTFISCDDKQHGPINEGGDVPSQVTDVQIIPTPGGADLVYSLPEDRELSYIEAIVNTPEGNIFNFKSSVYRDTISITGLATEKKQEVLLYSVNKSGIKSEPLSVNIEPLTPPYMKVLETLTLQDGLGGVDVRYDNETGAELAFFIGRVIDGQFIEEDSYYSNKKEGRVLFWGYEAEPQKFGIFIRDRWDHYSDTVYADITPILEIMFDKSKFKAVRLQHDSEHKTSAYEKPENLWDGHWSEDFQNPYTDGGTNWSHGAFYENTTLNESGAVTIDLGQLVNISRVRFNHYWTFDNHAPKKYELYGLLDYDENNIQYNMGAWHNWTLLAEIENVKPSTIGGTPEDDATSWEAGDIALLTPPSEAVRYIRIKSVESWNGKMTLDLAEITVYGQPIQ